MKYLAKINILPLAELLDPQGKAVKLGLSNLNLSAIHDVRVGKHVTLELEAANEGEANEMVESACRKLLVNRVMEQFHFTVDQI